MHFTLDLRFALPPLVNVLLYLLLNSEGHLWDWDRHPVLKMTSLIVGFLILYLMLSFIKPPLFSLLLIIPSQMGFGGNLHDFSMPLALTLLASFLFPPAPFWYAYLICVGVFSPWWNSVLATLKGFLHAMPVSFVTRRDLGQHEEETLESVLSSHSALHELGDEGDEYVLNQHLSGEHDENREIFTYGHA